MPLASTWVRPISPFAVLGLLWGAWAAVLPDIARTLHLDDRALGLSLTCAVLGALPAIWLAGRGGNRPGVPLLAPAVLLFGLTCLGPALASSRSALSVSLAIVGASSATLDVLMNAAVSEYEIVRRVRRMHVAHATYSAGVFVGSVSAGLLRQGHVPYAAILISCVAITMASALLARGTPSVPVVPHHAEGSAAGSAVPAALLGLGALCAVAFMREQGMELWSALHLERDLHAAPAVAGLGPGLLALSAVAGRLTGQTLAERAGEPVLLACAGTAAALGVVDFALAPSWGMALPGLLLSGGGVSVAAPTVVGLAGRLAGPERRGSAVSTVALIGYVGFLVGPLALGALADALGLRLALLSLTSCALIFGWGGSAFVASLGRGRAA